MSQAWAVALPREDAGCAASLRLEPGIEVCEAEDAIWLRGRDLGEKLAHQLRLLPGARRYAVWDDGQLQAVGTTAPKGHLPQGPWLAINRWLQLELPRAGWPSVAPATVRLSVVRSSDAHDATLLITTLDAWLAYGSTAPQLRLERLAFAMNDAGRVVVLGSPLPPLRGQRWVDRDGIATPAGWTWEPAVDPDVLRDLFALEPNDLALLHTDGTWEHILADNLVRATRSAIRQTAEQV
jgi:hypothetical protein